MPIIRTTLARACPAVVAWALLSLTLVAFALPGTARAGKPPVDQGTGRYIVAYDATGADAVTGGEVAAETERREAALGFEARHEYKRAVKGFAARLSEADVEALRREGGSPGRWTPVGNGCFDV